jgi:hypothetical protein
LLGHGAAFRPRGFPPCCRVVRAFLICSDDACTALFEAYGELEDIEALACGCGCGLAMVGWPEPVDEERADAELTFLAA